MDNPQNVIDEFPADLIGQPEDLSENYALTGGDAATGIAVFCSIGRWYANRGIWRQLWFVALPDGGVIFSKQYGKGDCAQGPCTGLGGIQVIESEKTLRLYYDGPSWYSTQTKLTEEGALQSPSKRAKLEIMVTSNQPVWNMHGGHSVSAAIAGRMHYEQIGQLSGLIEYDGQRYEIKNGFANRDHSRGPRDVSHYLHHVWASASFSNGDSVQVYAMQSNSGDGKGYDMSQATVLRDGKLYPADVELLTVSGAQPTDRAIDTIVLKCELGTLDIKSTRVLPQTPVSFAYPFDMMMGVPKNQECAVCLDGLVEYELDGVRGIGWCEIGTATGPLLQTN